MELNKSIKRIISGILFSSDEPITVKQLSEIINIGEYEVESVLAELIKEYSSEKHGFYLRQISGGYQFYVADEAGIYLQKIYGAKSQKLSQAALETLAIIAYKDQVTRGEIDLIRGVKSDAALRTIIERGLVEEKGRKDTPGRPIVFGVTALFYTSFGINSLEDLPKITNEIISKPEWLLEVQED